MCFFESDPRVDKSVTLPAVQVPGLLHGAGPIVTAIGLRPGLQVTPGWDGVNSTSLATEYVFRQTNARL
jgi:hypothetical protein